MASVVVAVEIFPARPMIRTRIAPRASAPTWAGLKFCHGLFIRTSPRLRRGVIRARLCIRSLCLLRFRLCLANHARSQRLEFCGTRPLAFSLGTLGTIGTPATTLTTASLLLCLLGFLLVAVVKRFLARRRHAIAAVTIFRFLVVRFRGHLCLLASVNRIAVDHHATTRTRRTLHAIGLQQTGADAFTRHLHQAQAGNLRNLVTAAVLRETLFQTPQHQILVFFQNHVDEVHDNHAAQIAQPNLTHNLVDGFQVVAGDGFFQVAAFAFARELTGVDVDDDHRLGTINHQRATRWQRNVAGKRRLNLFIDVIRRERILAIELAGVVLGDALEQIRGNGFYVGIDDAIGTIAVDNQLAVILVKQVANNLDQHVRLFEQRDRRGRFQFFFFFNALLNVQPLVVHAINVGCNSTLRNAFGCGTDDGSAVFRHHPFQHLFQARTLWRWKFARNACVVAAWYVDQVTARERNMRGQARALVAKWVFDDLHKHPITRLQRSFNATLRAVETTRLPVHFTRIQHGVAPLADVDERSFHVAQHIFDAPQIDVADDRALVIGVDEVLNQHVVFQQTQLGDGSRSIHARALADHHLAGDGITTFLKFTR